MKQISSRDGKWPGVFPNTNRLNNPRYRRRSTCFEIRRLSENERSADSNSPNSKVSPQPNNAGFSSQTPRQSSFMPLKQEEYPLEFPHATSNAMNQHFSPHATQSRLQNQQRPAVLNGGVRGHNVLPPGTPVDDLPTPDYSPIQKGPKHENPFTSNPNPNAYVNTQYQGASMGMSFQRMFFFSSPL